MAIKTIADRAAAVLPFVVVALAIANWYERPAAAWAWAVVIAMSVTMFGVRRGVQSHCRRAPDDVAWVKGLASVNTAVVSAGLMMAIPLAMTLASAHGLVDDADSGKRAVMILIGLYLVTIGNALPRNLPPVSSMPDNSARVQAFQRLAGWTWVLSGLGFAAAWAVLPIDAAGPLSVAMIFAALAATVVQVLRFRKPGPMPRT